MLLPPATLRAAHRGKLEIHHKHRRVLMAGREVELNHGEYACSIAWPAHQGQVFSKAQLYAAAWGEEYLHGTNSVEKYHLAAEEKSWSPIQGTQSTLKP